MLALTLLGIVMFAIFRRLIGDRDEKIAARQSTTTLYKIRFVYCLILR